MQQSGDASSPLTEGGGLLMGTSPAHLLGTYPARGLVRSKQSGISTMVSSAPLREGGGEEVHVMYENDNK